MVRPPYPTCVYLCALAAERWAEIDAAYHASPMPLLRRPLHQFLNLVYAWAIERVPSDDLEQWKMDLVELLPWQDTNSEAAAALESESFLAMQRLGGG